MGTALEIARSLVEQAIPVLRCHPGLKRPHANAAGTWDSIDDPDALDYWLKPGDNLAILLGWGKQSPVIAVGLDVYKDPRIVNFAKELGVTSNANIWAQRTGRGGYTPIYYYNGPPLKRDCVQEGSAIDLLTNGYTLIPPSNTSNETDGGGPYAWLSGHSPLDVPLADLDEPPKDLLLWWESLSAPNLPDVQRDSAQGRGPSWLTGPIPKGQRNKILTKRAGYYHRKLPDDEVVRDLVHAANRTQCLPPLPDREVDAILNSILKREGASHFKGAPAASLAGYVRREVYHA